LASGTANDDGGDDDEYRKKNPLENCSATYKLVTHEFTGNEF